jgi:chemotaxis protein CheX
MRLDYITPIVESAANVLTEVTGSPVAYGAMKLYRTSSAGRDVVIVVGLSGEVEGRIMLEMDDDAAMSLAGTMNREKFTTLTPLAEDTLMELGNMLVARAVSTLNDMGFEFLLTPPVLFAAGNRALFTTLDLETLVVPLHTDGLAMNLSFALKIHSL